MKPLHTLFLCSLAIGCGNNPTVPNQQVDRTNTGVNTRDRDPSALTPLDQNENQADVTMTADIRKRVVGATSSVNAQNIKIMTQGGKVTLRGPVDSDKEKQQIERIALDVAGDNNVDSHLEIAKQ